MIEPTANPATARPLQPLLDQFLETARALVPGGATKATCELSTGGHIVASASHLTTNPSESRGVVLFGCAEALRAADPRVVDAELRRLVRTSHVPIDEQIVFQWSDGRMNTYDGSLPLPEC